MHSALIPNVLWGRFSPLAAYRLAVCNFGGVGEDEALGIAVDQRVAVLPLLDILDFLAAIVGFDDLGGGHFHRFVACVAGLDFFNLLGRLVVVVEAKVDVVGDGDVVGCHRFGLSCSLLM